MGKRTAYAPGVFCWADLSTTDPDAAKRFYGELFGWQPEDMPAGDGMIYTMMRIDGDDVAAVARQQEAQQAAGVPPFWLSYVSVESADETAARAKELGGGVHVEPFDVLEAGRMALIADPSGAMLAAWEPREHIGASRVNDPGCLTWNEMATNDPEAAERFFSGLFGWEFEEVAADGGPRYWGIHHDGAAARRNGGMRELGDGEPAPPHWMSYFTVESTDAAVDRARDLGANVLMEPMDIGAGRIGVLQDPQGAVFGVFAGDVDD